MRRQACMCGKSTHRMTCSRYWGCMRGDVRGALERTAPPRCCVADCKKAAGVTTLNLGARRRRSFAIC